MKYHKQIINHDPANGKYGDCMRTAIACIMNKESVLDVPHFAEKNLEAKEHYSYMRSWLKDNGYQWLTIQFDNKILSEVLEYMKVANPGIAYMLGGPTDYRSEHVVIACEDKIIHDPHPENIGISEKCGSRSYYGAYLIVPIEIN